MTDYDTFTVDGCARFPVLPPGAFPEAAGARLLTRSAAIRDGERAAVARAVRALVPRILPEDGASRRDEDVRALIRDRILARAPAFVVSRNVVSDGGDDVELVVTMQVAVDVAKLAASLVELRPSAPATSPSGQGGHDVA